MALTLYWLCALIVCAAWWPRCRELHEKRARVTMLTILFAVLLAYLMHNRWLGAYTLIFVVGLWRVPSPYDRLYLTVWPALLFGALYVLLASQVTVAWVEPALWSIVACGLILCAWWGVSLWINAGHYDRLFQWRGKTWLHLYEHQPAFNPQPFLCCGQGNVNFAQALAGAATAAACGLTLLGSTWAPIAFVLCSLPLLKIKGKRHEWTQPSQGWGYLAVILAAAGSVQWGFSFAVVAASVLIVLALVVWESYPQAWSGRQEAWAYAWQVFRDMSWPGKLIGAGPESWINIVKRDGENRWTRIQRLTAFFTHSHNEFVNALVETGALGVLAMAGYCATTLYALMQAGSPEAGALFVLGAFLVACACLSFPWSLYHEIIMEGNMSGHGMPILNVVSLAFVVLAEGVLR